MLSILEPAQAPVRPTPSKIVPVKLNAQELEWLDSILETDNTRGFENRGEVLRLLLHLEYRRRHNMGKPSGRDWQSSARNGRPKVKGN